MVQRSAVPSVLGLPGHLEGRHDLHPALLLAAQGDEPGDGDQLPVEQVVVVEGGVADRRAGPPVRGQQRMRPRMLSPQDFIFYINFTLHIFLIEYPQRQGEDETKNDFLPGFNIAHIFYPLQ